MVASGSDTGGSPPSAGPLPRIAVVVRKRPLSALEAMRRDIDLVRVKSGHTVVLEEPREKVDLTPYVLRHEFRVDRAFDETASNSEVYRQVVSSLVESCCTKEASCSFFAYGQTGSGKTFTMLGPQGSAEQPGDDQGIFAMAAHDIFDYLKADNSTKTVSVSFFEIYNGRLFDLLQDRKLVAALENGKKEVIVKDLREDDVATKEDLLKRILGGMELRRIGANSVNDESSRSHAVLQIHLRKPSGKVAGRLVFIDLAGSERGADTLQQSRQTQQDGAGINRSLLALKECIRAMDRDQLHIPFRDSELTKVLREVFVGRSSRSVMIATISPASSCCEQTLNTLRYASRVKNFKQQQPSISPVGVSSLTDEASEFRSCGGQSSSETSPRLPPPTPLGGAYAVAYANRAPRASSYGSPLLASSSSSIQAPLGSSSSSGRPIRSAGTARKTSLGNVLLASRRTVGDATTRGALGSISPRPVQDASSAVRACSQQGLSEAPSGFPPPLLLLHKVSAVQRSASSRREHGRPRVCERDASCLQQVEAKGVPLLPSPLNTARQQLQGPPRPVRRIPREFPLSPRNLKASHSTAGAAGIVKHATSVEASSIRPGFRSKLQQEQQQHEPQQQQKRAPVEKRATTAAPANTSALRRSWLQKQQQQQRSKRGLLGDDGETLIFLKEPMAVAGGAEGAKDMSPPTDARKMTLDADVGERSIQDEKQQMQDDSSTAEAAAQLSPLLNELHVRRLSGSPSSSIHCSGEPPSSSNTNISSSNTNISSSNTNISSSSRLRYKAGAAIGSSTMDASDPTHHSLLEQLLPSPEQQQQHQELGGDAECTSPRAATSTPFNLTRLLQQTLQGAELSALSAAELESLQAQVSGRRQHYMKRLLELLRGRAAEGSGAQGHHERQQDELVCRLHEKNPCSPEFAEYARQKMELEFKRLLRMRHCWLQAEELRLVHRHLGARQLNEAAPSSSTPNLHTVGTDVAGAGAHTEAAVPPACTRLNSSETRLAAWLAHAASGVHTPRWLASLSPRSSVSAWAIPGTPAAPLEGALSECGGPPGGASEEDTSPASSVRGKRPPPSGVDTPKSVNITGSATDGLLCRAVGGNWPSEAAAQPKKALLGLLISMQTACEVPAAILWGDHSDLQNKYAAEKNSSSLETPAGKDCGSLEKWVAAPEKEARLRPLHVQQPPEELRRLSGSLLVRDSDCFMDVDAAVSSS
ncbi:uncharacterized protein LOC34623217 [Cyclospora cayetanensis]|uniref:Uncharacterized protein LOC34623217 n=1 Tax=Cyclospora cayetanensis TaxID=88456 RepID=A0A6P6RTS9_9EIME|nr:uncharacterized protein LOC34623217 [Cyclospora cayetanensis]